MKRVLVLGAGKVGQDFTAQLARAGVQVSLYARERQRDELTERGVSYLTRSNKVQYQLLPAARIITSLEEIDVDAAIVCFRSEQRAEAGKLLRSMKHAPPIAAFAFPVWPRSELDFIPPTSAKAFIVPRVFAFRGPFDPSSTRIECIDPGARPLAETLMRSDMRVTHVERLREAFARNLVLGLPAIRALSEHSFSARDFAGDQRSVEATLDYQESLTQRIAQVSRPRLPPRFLRRQILRNLGTLFSLGRRDIVESHVRGIAEQARTLLAEFETLYP